MTILTINTGTAANQGNGDTLRTAFMKINNNFEYLNSSTIALVSQIPTTSTSTGTVGQLSLGTSSIYVCVGTNQWLRITGSTF